MSDTPRTDAICNSMPDDPVNKTPQEARVFIADFALCTIRLADLCRNLERELAKLEALALLAKLTEKS